MTGRNHLVEEVDQNWRKTTQLLVPCSFLVVALNFEAADFDMSGMQMPRIGDSCAAIWDDAYICLPTIHGKFIIGFTTLLKSNNI